MKMKNVFILLAAITLVACSSNSSNNLSSFENNQDSSSLAFDNGDSSDIASASNNTDVSTSSIVVDGETLSFNFFNPKCGTAGTNALNNTLKNYMNDVAGTTFVSGVTNSNCQIMDTAPSTGNSRLTIGSAKNAGELEITFANNIKAVKITAVSYYKYYDGGNHPDSKSLCYINEDSNVIDVTMTASEEPKEKELTVLVNAKKVKLYNKEGGNRSYIKTIACIY